MDDLKIWWDTKTVEKNVAVASTKANNISFTNSTFYKCEKMIGSTPTSSTSILLESCTFNDAPSGNNSFCIDYNTSTVTGSITVSNCIFGTGRLSGTT